MLCYLSDFFKSIGFPLVMGFVAIFVPGTKYITCDELAEFVEESKKFYDEEKEHEAKDHEINKEEARNMINKRKFLLLDARRKDEFCVSHILLFINFITTLNEQFVMVTTTHHYALRHQYSLIFTNPSTFFNNTNIHFII